MPEAKLWLGSDRVDLTLRAAHAQSSEGTLKIEAPNDPSVPAPVSRIWAPRGCTHALLLNAKIGLELVSVRIECGVRDHIDNLAVLDHIMTVRNGGREVEVLLHK